MPIDTAEERRTISGINWGSPPTPTPNVNKDVQWRAQIAWGYGGTISPYDPLRFRPSIHLRNIRRPLFPEIIYPVTIDANWREFL